MKHLLALIFAGWIFGSVGSAQFQPKTLEPPDDPFNGRVTIVPNTGVVPVEPILDVTQPIQLVFETACGAINSAGGAVS